MDLMYPEISTDFYFSECSYHVNWTLFCLELNQELLII